ncbi:hypothetical protein PGT21_033277 [Puccinia graminis f. sp. tritici]|uniref:Uncharacterized protein n=1 Tax=Puccinia graminis f. sp. tritici TaxID=56615 RepID=A0A5B0LZ37_PUCGR|nr:hypothetical protein PGT21_033277 [Puccinia graminis f. sp. tritici]
MQFIPHLRMVIGPGVQRAAQTRPGLGQAFYGIFYLGPARDDPIKGRVYSGCLLGRAELIPRSEPTPAPTPFATPPPQVLAPGSQLLKALVIIGLRAAHGRPVGSPISRPDPPGNVPARFEPIIILNPTY